MIADALGAYARPVVGVTDRIPVWVLGKVPVYVGGDFVWVEEPAVVPMALTAWVQARGFCGRNRPAVEHNDYTTVSPACVELKAGLT